MKIAALFLGLLLAMFVLAPAPVIHAQSEDGTCSDGLDNDGDGLIDLADPSCTELSEAPDPTPTAEPTAEPTPVTTATDAPTATPVVTPSDVPDTGGDPGGDGDAVGDALNDLQFSEWITQAGIAGAVSSFIITLLVIFGISLTSQYKRILAFSLGLATAILYVAIQDNIEIKSLEDVVTTVLFVLTGSQIAYLIFDGLLQGAVARVRGD